MDSDDIKDAILGNGKKISVNDKEYVLKPPNVKRITGAAKYLSELEGGETFKDAVEQMKSVQSACYALSWFIQGDGELAEELSRGTLTDIVGGLSKAIQMISIRDFATISMLAKSLERMAANPRP